MNITQPKKTKTKSVIYCPVCAVFILIKKSINLMLNCCNRVWQTEVVKRDEEIRKLRNSLQFETEELSRIKEGLLKIQSELAQEIKQLKEENEELSLYKHACNESIAHLHRENDIFKQLIALAYTAGVSGVSWNEFQDKHNL